LTLFIFFVNIKTMSEENQKQYELILILSPNLSDEEFNILEKEIQKNIEELEGKIVKQNKPEKRELAYPIKKFNIGYYLIVSLLINPQRLAEFKSGLDHHKNILRYIIAFVEKEKTIKNKPEKLTKVGGVLKLEKEDQEKDQPLADVKKSILSKKKEARKEKEEEKKREEKQKKSEEKKKKTTLEDIDKKLDDILGM